MNINNYIILYVTSTYWLASRGYKLYRYDVTTRTWSFFSILKDKKNALLSSFFLTRRLFRAEIRNLYRFKNDNWMCIANKAIFKYDTNRKTFKKCCEIDKGSRPMNLCQDTNGTIYFGDYFYNPDKREVHIHKSQDNGDTWEIAYTFKKNEINHIHGIFNDQYSKKIWIATGDDDSACIFGYTEDGFKTIVEKYRGSQQYRLCAPLFYRDFIVFATDSQYEQNVIRKIDRKTGRIADLQMIQGSGIYGVKFGKYAAISTTVEPSTVNTDSNSFLWVSDDGLNWKEITHYKKDIWMMTYFQFGSIRFPIYEAFEKEYNQLIINGRALKRLDGNSKVFTIPEILK